MEGQEPHNNQDILKKTVKGLQLPRCFLTKQYYIRRTEYRNGLYVHTHIYGFMTKAALQKKKKKKERTVFSNIGAEPISLSIWGKNYF